MPLHRHLRPTILILGLLVAALASPSSAGAGQLTEIICADATTGKGVGAIAPELSNPYQAGGLGLMTAYSDCAGDMTGSKGIVLRPYPGHYADNDWGAIAYDAPPNLTLSGAYVWRAFTAPPLASYFMTAQEASAPGDLWGVPWSERFDWSWGQEVNAGTTAAPFSSGNGAGFVVNNGHWYVHMRCDSPDSSGCNVGGGQSEYRIYGGRLALVDESTPQVAAGTSGTLGTADVLQGTEEVTVSATDVGAGVYRGRALVDGNEVAAKVVDTNGGHCVDLNPANADPYEFDRGRPCKLSASGTVSFDTTTWPEGAHNLKFLVEDAAGNGAIAVNRAVTIDNIPPPANTALPTLTGRAADGELMVTGIGSWTGQSLQFSTRWQRTAAAGWVDIPGAGDTTYRLTSADAGHEVRSCVVASNVEGSAEACSAPSATVDAATKATESSGTVKPAVPPQAASPGAQTPPPSSPPAPVVAHPANGEGGGDGTRLVAAVGREQQRTVRVAYGRQAVITGRVTGPSGHPVRGAIVDVRTAPRLTGAAMAAVGQVLTDDDGTFHYAAAGGPSRVVRFSYRAHVDDVDFGQTSDVTLLVRAGVKLRLDHRTLRNRQLLKYLGQLLGPHTTGKIVDIQVRNGRRWQLVCSVKTRARGRFSCSHRFTRTFYPTTYTFRARARTQAAFPYDSGTSKSVRVKVRP
jgi:hypothetical protein